MDIFKEKLLTSPVSAHFPDYKGADGDFNAAREYFKQRFMKLNRSSSKEVYCTYSLLLFEEDLADARSPSIQGQYTTAIDTTLLRVVMISVQDSILQRNLAAITF